MAESIGELVVKLGMDSTLFERSTKELNQRMKTLKSEFQYTTEQAKLYGNTTDSLQAKATSLHKAIDTQKAKLEKLRDEYNRSKEETGENSVQTQKLAEQVNKAASELTVYERQLKETQTAISGQTTKTKDLKHATEELASKMEATSKTVGKIGSTLTKSVKVPLTAAATASVKLAMNFETSMAKVATIADETSVPIETMRESILGLSNDTGQAAGDLAEATYQAISAGVDTARAVDFTNTATKAAVGGFTDAATAVDGLSSTLNAYGLEADQADSIANQMLITQNKGKTTFGELAGSIGKVAPIASALNISTDELFSSLAVLTANGIQTSESVSALKAAFSNVAKPTKEATEAAEALGIEFNADSLASKGLKGFLVDVRTAMSNMNPTIGALLTKQDQLTEKLKKTKKGTDAYKELSKELKNTNSDLEILTSAGDSSVSQFSTMFGSVEALNAMLILSSEQGMSLYDETMQEMQSNATALDDAYNTMTDTVEFRMQKSFNELKNSGIEMGSALLPWVDKLAGGISDLAEKFMGLDEEQQKNILTMGGVALAAGPVLSIMSNVISVGGTLIKGIGMIGPALGALTGPVGIALAAVGGVTLAFAGVKAAIEHARDEAINFGPKLQEACKNFDEVAEKADKTHDLTKEYEELAKKIDEGQVPMDELKAAQDRLKEIGEDLVALHPDIVSKYDVENGRIREKLGLLDQEADKMLALSKNELLNTVAEARGKIPALKETIDELNGSLDEAYDRESKIAESQNAISELAAEYEKLREANPYADLSDTAQKYTDKINEIAGPLGYHIEGMGQAYDLAESLGDEYGSLQKKIGDYEEDLTDAQESLDSYYDANKRLIEIDMGSTFEEYESGILAMRDAYAELITKGEISNETMETAKLLLPELGQEGADQAKILKDGMAEWTEKLTDGYQDLADLNGELSDYTGTVMVSKDRLHEYTGAVDSLTNIDLAGALEEQETKMQLLNDAMETLTGDGELAEDAIKNLTDTFPELAEQDINIDSIKGVMEKLGDEIQTSKQRSDDLRGSLDSLKSKTITIKTNYVSNGASGVASGALPKYAKGTGKSGVPGGPVIIDEEGTEMLVFPNRRIALAGGPKGPKLVNLPKGTQVIPAQLTQQLMSSMQRPKPMQYIPGFTEGTVTQAVLRDIVQPQGTGIQGSQQPIVVEVHIDAKDLGYKTATYSGRQMAYNARREIVRV